jgi:membrane protein DedA with SNARE-associated domain
LEAFVEKFTQHGYIAVFVLMLLESACIPIPSEITMVLAGVAISPRADPGFCGGCPQLNFFAIVLVGVAGNLVGSWLAYGVGRATGRGWIDRWGRYVGIRSHDVDRAERWWAKHGPATVFFSRMLPVVRTFISLPAGIEKMPLRRFTLYTVAGCIPWVFALTLAGYQLGFHWKSITGPFRYASAAILAAIVFAFIVYVIRRRQSEMHGAP